MVIRIVRMVMRRHFVFTFSTIRLLHVENDQPFSSCAPLYDRLSWPLSSGSRSRFDLVIIYQFCYWWSLFLFPCTYTFSISLTASSHCIHHMCPCHLSRFLRKVVSCSTYGLDMRWQRNEPWQIPYGREMLRSKEHEESSNRVVGQCKGMDRTGLERVVERTWSGPEDRVARETESVVWPQRTEYSMA